MTSWVWLYALLSVIGISAVSLTGLLAFLDEKRLQGWVFFLVSLSVGAMFGDVFIHLLPEAFSRTENPMNVSLGVLSGLLLFFLLEKVLWWRHHHVPHDGACVTPFGHVNMVADSLHNFVDGFLIATAYMVSIPAGVGTTVAVLLHEIPQEIGDVAVLLHAGFSRARAITVNMISASLAILGAVLALLVGHQVAGLPDAVLPLTAGGFVYIAGCDLVPELHKEREIGRSLLQLLALALGVGAMVLLTGLN